MSEARNSSDEALVYQVTRRRGEALAEIYRRHGGAVFGLARRVLRSEAHAADVVQEVVLAFWQAPERFDPARGGLRSYLLTQAHGRAVDIARSESARALRQERWARAFDQVHDLGHAAAEGDLRRRAVASLEALTADERRAITLAYFGGFTYVEVAEILRAPEGTIKSRIRSGLLRMRQALTETTEDEA